jgi:hypothetical protein
MSFGQKLALALALAMFAAAHIIGLRLSSSISPPSTAATLSFEGD